MRYQDIDGAAEARPLRSLYGTIFQVLGSDLKGAMAEDGGDAEAVLARFAQASIEVDALAAQLKREGAQTFVTSWKELLQRIADKSDALADAG